MKKMFLTLFAIGVATAMQAQVGKTKVVTDTLKAAPSNKATIPVSTATSNSTTSSSKKKEDAGPIKDLDKPTKEEEKFAEKLGKKIDKITKDAPPPPIKKM